MTDENHIVQFSLLVVFFIATLAIVGLVVLVIDATSVKTVATGGQLASADQNTAGVVSSGCYAMRGGIDYYMNSGDRAGAYKIMQRMVSDGCTNW